MFTGTCEERGHANEELARGTVIAVGGLSRLEPGLQTVREKRALLGRDVPPIVRPKLPSIDFTGWSPSQLPVVAIEEGTCPTQHLGEERHGSMRHRPRERRPRCVPGLAECSGDALRLPCALLVLRAILVPFRRAKLDGAHLGLKTGGEPDLQIEAHERGSERVAQPQRLGGGGRV